jgi:hypothetical protein
MTVDAIEQARAEGWRSATRRGAVDRGGLGARASRL